MTDAPVAGAVTSIPGKLLEAIRVPAFTFAIVASAPMTVIDPGVIASVAEGEATFFPDPQPATAKPRTAKSASTTTRFTWPFIAPGRPDVNIAHRESFPPPAGAGPRSLERQRMQRPFASNPDRQLPTDGELVTGALEDRLGADRVDDPEVNVESRPRRRRQGTPQQFAPRARFVSRDRLRRESRSAT